MSQDHADFARFSQELDAEWLRQRVHNLVATSTPVIDEDALVRALGQADPLAESPRPRWRETIAAVLGSWPARLSLAGAACALVIIGAAVGRLAPLGSLDQSVRVSQLRGTMDVQPPVPVYTPERTPRLGMTASVKPDSDRQFHEAMAFYGTADFPTRALPLLRAAVTEDPSNDQAQFWLGIALLLSGQDAEAVPALEEAIRLGPGSALYKRYLVYAYLRTGASEKALALQMELLRQP